MPGLRLVTFDLDNTLWDMRRVLHKADRQLREWLVVQHPSLEKVLQGSDFNALRKKLVESEPALQHDPTKMRLRMIFDVLVGAGFSPEWAKSVSRQALDRFLEVRHQVVYYDGALEVLDVLGSRFMLGALTNGNADVCRLGLDRYFRFAYNSIGVGLGKPDPKMFQYALKTAGVAPSEAVHIGDDPEDDIAAAQAVGMHALHVRVSEDTPTLPPEVVPSVSDLRNIPAAIADLNVRLRRNPSRPARIDVPRPFNNRAGF